MNIHGVTMMPCTTKILPRFTGDRGISAPAPSQMLPIFSENLVSTSNLDSGRQEKKKGRKL